MKSYNFIEKKFNEIGILSEVTSIMSWDANVMMPSKASEARGQQLAYLGEQMHKIITDVEVKEHLENANNEINELDDWQKANLKLIERQIINASVLSSELVNELAIASNECEMVWRTAKSENNFKMVEPHLQKIVDLKRQEANLKGERLGISPYNALLADYDYGRTTEELDVLFSDLKNFLIDFSNKVIQKQEKVDFKERSYPKGLQDKVFRQYLSYLNFDFDSGRLDQSAHPFCGGIPQDSRLTTWYKEKDFVTGIYAVIHEGGHSLYERNLPKQWRRQPVGNACGFAIHESQSLFIEKQIGMNYNFTKNLYTKVTETFKFQDLSFREFNYLISKIERSFIRVDADEVTYPLHVIMRYEIEKDLISGNLEVKDLPKRWNEDMKNFLGITPPTDTLGCLQDIHWYAGYFGYFPAYTVGALTAAQIMAKICSEMDNVDEQIANNNIQPIIKWLNTNIHAQGSKYTSSELTKIVTGQPLDVTYYKDYLTNRYLNNSFNDA